VDFWSISFIWDHIQRLCFDSSIKRGLRALEACEFPMPSNTVVPIGMGRELTTEVAETVPPQKEII